MTGGGTLNLVVNYVRYPLSGNWSGFTGQINVTGAGFPNVNNNTLGAVTADIDEFRINNTYGYSNAVIYLYGSTAPGNQNTPQSTLVMCQTVASGATIDIGELGSDPSTPTPIMGTGTGSAGNTTWRVGWKNTTNTFYGVIANDSQTGVGVSSITKVGTGEWNLAGANTYSGSTTVSNGVLALITNPNTYNDASIANSANIFINTNAMLDLSGLSSPTLTLNAGQTLGGGGTLKGGVAANTGANINPGSAVATGALTITGGLTESGGVNNNFQLTNISPNVINVQGDLNVSSGTQNINLSGFGTNTIAPGTYPLFTYTGNFYGARQQFPCQFGASAYTATVTNITTTTPPEIAVVIAAPSRQPSNLTWVGDGAANNWDNVGIDWLSGASPPTLSFRRQRHLQRCRRGEHECDLAKLPVSGLGGGEQLDEGDLHLDRQRQHHRLHRFDQNQQWHVDHSGDQHLHRTDGHWWRNDFDLVPAQRWLGQPHWRGQQQFDKPAVHRRDPGLHRSGCEHRPWRDLDWFRWNLLT